MNELLFLGTTIALRGCDTTSYFYGVGRIKPFQKNYEKQKCTPA